LGHIIAGRPGTSVAYIVLARDIVKDITEKLGSQTVQMACETELEVTEAVEEIKRTIPLDELGSSCQDVSGGTFATPVEAIALAEDRSMRGTALQDSPGKLIQRSFTKRH
jgi:hypothetical protein